MKKTLFLMVIGLILTAAPAHAQLGLGMVPMRVELKMAPGQQYSGSLKLSNQSGAKARVRAEMLDFDYDDKATPQFERNLPQETAYSCKKWLSLNPMEIELDKDGYLMVRYTLRLPAELPEGSYNCAAGFTTLPAAEEMSDMGMRMAVRIVAAIYVVVGNPPVRGALKEIKLERVAASKDSPETGWQAVVVLDNPGHTYFRPTGKLEVLDAEGKAVEAVEFQSLPVLPERSQRFLFPLKTHLEAGRYKLRARVDIGTGEVQEGSADISLERPAGIQTVTRKVKQ
jgi:P pilus assembly chaperone PapD